MVIHMFSLTIFKSGLTSNDRSFLTAQMQMAIEIIDIKIKGMKTKIQKCRCDSKLSHTSSSNNKSSR